MKFNNIYVLLYPLKNNSFCCIIYMYLCTETLGGETFEGDKGEQTNWYSADFVYITL